MKFFLFTVYLLVLWLFVTGCGPVPVECTPCGNDLNGAGQCCDEYSQCVSIDNLLECQRKP